MTGKIVTIQKTTTTKAVQINTPEEDAEVRTWLADMFKVQIDQITQEEAEDLARAQDLSPIVGAGGWFAKDEGNPIIYIISPEDYDICYDKLDVEEIKNVAEAFKL